MGKFFYSTNNKKEKVDFKTALLNGIASNYGLYMIDRKNIPRLSSVTLENMKKMSYSEIAFQVLNPFIGDEFKNDSLELLLDDAYDESKIPTEVDKIVGNTYIMWLTKGPTSSFKDYAARFFGRTLNQTLEEQNLKRTVIVATSGDTGGAVAEALHKLDNIVNIVFYPKGSISEGQRRQMTTLKHNVHAFEVDGDFDVCQTLAKYFLGDKKFFKDITGDENNATSANSISLGRLLPQSVYPFFAYSRIDSKGLPLFVSIPSGNFGDMMGTVLAKEMGLPIDKIICGVNENTEFPDFLRTGEYMVKPSKDSPSSAMIVSHPSNLARLIDFYGGHMYDERNSKGKVIREGVIDKMPDMDAIRGEIYSWSINNQEHKSTIQEVYDKHKVILDPHGAVGWKALEIFNRGDFNQPAVIYETADPGKFQDYVKSTLQINIKLPHRMKLQKHLKERIYSIESPSLETYNGLKLSDNQIKEAKEKIRDILSS